jgi:hypothetical protein
MSSIIESFYDWMTTMTIKEGDYYEANLPGQYAVSLAGCGGFGYCCGLSATLFMVDQHDGEVMNED